MTFSSLKHDGAYWAYQLGFPQVKRVTRVKVRRGISRPQMVSLHGCPFETMKFRFGQSESFLALRMHSLLQRDLSCHFATGALRGVWFCNLEPSAAPGNRTPRISSVRPSSRLRRNLRVKVHSPKVHTPK